MSNSREDRKRIMLRAQVRLRGSVLDAQLYDASSRGLSIGAAHAPPRGEIVEIVMGNTVMAGQVRWTRGNRFGVVLHERIDVDALRNGQLVRRGSSRSGSNAQSQSRFELHDLLFLAACGLAAVVFLLLAYNRWA